MNNEELFEQNINLAYKIANTYKTKYPNEYEDIKQIALIGLWEATKKYNKTYKFSPFAWIVIHREINRYLNKQKKYMETISLDSQRDVELPILENLKAEENKIEDMLVKNNNDKAFKELAELANLAPKEIDTLNEMRKGSNATQISKKFNVSKQCISERIRTIFKKIEKVITSDEKEMFM